jgi:hypothetical protein
MSKNWIIVLESCYCLNIVAYLLKARTVEPEKQPLLANGYETTFLSGQRLGKHVPAEINDVTTPVATAADSW